MSTKLKCAWTYTDGKRCGSSRLVGLYYCGGHKGVPTTNCKVCGGRGSLNIRDGTGNKLCGHCEGTGDVEADG